MFAAWEQYAGKLGNATSNERNTASGAVTTRNMMQRQVMEKFLLGSSVM